MSNNNNSFTISVVADDELRVSSGPDNTSQKMLSENPKADPTQYWSPKWTREIVSYITTSEYLQAKYPKHINYIVWTAYRSADYPEHSTLVKALRMLLGAWMYDCTIDKTCLAPPSRKMLGDSEFRKVLDAYNKLKNQVANLSSQESEPST